MSNEIAVPDKPIDDLESDREYRFKLYDRGLASVSALGIILSGIFGLVSYSNQRKAENELKHRELQLSIYREKKEIYYPLCESASAIVCCKSQHEAETHMKEFLTLYRGKAHLIAIEPEVNNAKVDFKKELVKWIDQNEQKPPSVDLINLSLKLTDACRARLNPEQAFAN